MNISSNQNGNNETKHDDVKPTFIPKVKSNKKFRKKRSIDDVSINQPSDSKQEPQDEEDYAYDILFKFYFIYIFIINLFFKFNLEQSWKKHVYLNS